MKLTGHVDCPCPAIGTISDQPISAKLPQKMHNRSRADELVLTRNSHVFFSSIPRKAYSDCFLKENGPQIVQTCKSKPIVSQIFMPGPLQFFDLNESSKFEEVASVPQRYWDLLYDLACNTARMDPSE
jgi:hypothetical protein